MEKNIKRDIWRITVIVLASILMAGNIKILVNAGGLFPGGFTGIAVMIQRCFDKFLGIEMPYFPISIILNAVPAAICFKTIGKKFTALSCLCIVLTSLLTDLIPPMSITYDVLLISIFGGILMGAGIGLCLLAEATSGGTDFIAMSISEKYGVDAFRYILCGNIIVLIIAGILFGWDAALYSIIFQFCSTQMVQMLNRRYKKNTLLIVTEKPEEVIEAIFQISHHGATRIDAHGTYSNEQRPIIYSIVSTPEVKKIIATIKNIDESAFVNIIKTEDVSGYFYIRPMD